MTIRIRIEIEPLKSGRLVLDKEMEEGSTLEDLLNKLAITHSEVIKYFYDMKDRKLTGAAAIALNGSLIQSLNGLETRIDNGDVVAVIPLLVGG